MKYINNYIWLLFIVLFAQGCKEDTLSTYPEEEGGDNIYFVEKFFRNSQDPMVRMISLGQTPTSVKDSLINILIRTTGEPSTEDRPVTVYAADTSSMKEGVHFDYVGSPKIRAGRVTDTLKVLLHRTEDLLTTRVYLNLQLKSNENFQTNIATKKNGSNVQDLLSLQLYMDDLFPVPYLWTTFSGKSLVEGYWGPYSRKKVELMLEVMKVDASVFYDSKKPFSIGTLLNFASYMKYWLTKEENEGRIYYDDKGNKITMGPFAS